MITLQEQIQTSPSGRCRGVEGGREGSEDGNPDEEEAMEVE